MAEQINSPEPAAAPQPQTRWSLIRRAAGGDECDAALALNEICQHYWYPVYAWVRRAGKSVESAEDLTQAFFADLLRRNWFRTVDPARGKLRNYLLVSLQLFLSGEDRRDRAQKRGGGKAVISLDAEQAENRYVREPADEMTPDRLFQRRWALTVLEHAVKELAAEYYASGKGALFQTLRRHLGFSVEEISGDDSYRAAAEALGMSEPAIRTAVSRLRSRFREVLFHQVAETLGTEDPLEIKAEMGELIGMI